MGILGQILGKTTTTIPESQVLFSATDETIISSVTACNLSTTNARAVSIYVVPKGQTKANVHALYFASSIAVGSVLICTAGLTLGPGDRILVDCGADSEVAFHAYGTVI